MMLEQLLSKVDKVRIGVMGDFCLDVYWHADMKRSELSRETPHFPLPVVAEKMSPGGAGNVCANLAALKPQAVLALGAVGQDWRGRELIGCLRQHGVVTDGLVERGDYITNGYIKPIRSGISEVAYEDPRIDFENFEPASEQLEQQLLAQLDSLAKEIDVLCVCDQMKNGCITPAIRQRICELGKRGLPILVDSRERVNLYKHVILKPNEVEAARAVSSSSLEEAALLLSKQTGSSAIITLGKDGCYVSTEGTVEHINSFPVEPPLDICGAGDTFLSAVACALATGATITDAAAFGCLASSITVQKVGITGTASREELKERYDERHSRE